MISENGASSLSIGIEGPRTPGGISSHAGGVRISSHAGGVRLLSHAGGVGISSHAGGVGILSHAGGVRTGQLPILMRVKLARKPSAVTVISTSPTPARVGGSLALI